MYNVYTRSFWAKKSVETVVLQWFPVILFVEMKPAMGTAETRYGHRFGCFLPSRCADFAYFLSSGFSVESSEQRVVLVRILYTPGHFWLKIRRNRCAAMVSGDLMLRNETRYGHTRNPLWAQI